MPGNGISIVAPLYNEENLVETLYKRLKNALKDYPNHEIVLVNDGSSDRTLEILTRLAGQDPRLVVLELSRNFGHQAALFAGICAASQETIVTMDGDLQDPPELIPALLAEQAKGAEVVIAMRRTRQERGLRRALFELFHAFFRWMSDTPINSSGTFGLLGGRAAQQIIRLQEHSRYFPGLRNWIGFRQSILWYDRDERIAGKPKQSLTRLLSMGFDAVFSFSYKPLRVSWLVGMVISSFSFVYGLTLLILRLNNINVISGFTTVATAVFFLGGIQLTSLGVMGEYLLRIYDESKNRPHFIISRKISQNGEEQDEP